MSSLFKLKTILIYPNLIADLPQCKVLKINNGISSTSRSEIDHEDRVHYYCNKGYELNGASVLTCNEGNFDNKPPSCDEIEGLFDIRLYK